MARRLLSGYDTHHHQVVKELRESGSAALTEVMLRIDSERTNAAHRFRAYQGCGRLIAICEGTGLLNGSREGLGIREEEPTVLPSPCADSSMRSTIGMRLLPGSTIIWTMKVSFRWLSISLTSAELMEGF